jgi:hypothetical protein
MPLGKLKKVELREFWKHEAIDFTKWLAQEENLKALGDELEYSLVLVGTETSVGNFNCDILAEEEDTKNKVVIENQLEATNHDHLGKLLTYAAGHGATAAVWVVSQVREEHRKAIDWLNEHTDDEISFYLLRIELWQIGDSPFAPKFELICKPNDWARKLKESAAQGEPSATKLDQLEFWTQFRTFVTQKTSALRPQKPAPQHWTNIGIGSSEAYISLTINSQKNIFACALTIQDNKPLYQQLLTHKADIERELGEQLEWMELPDAKASRIRTSLSGNFADKQKWPDQFAWLLHEAQKFHQVFPKYLKLVQVQPAEAG